jgi:hypothetical protein
MKKDLCKHELEDYKTDVTRKEVLQFIEKIATSSKPCQKRVEPPAVTSS